MTSTEIAELAERLTKLNVERAQVDTNGNVMLVFFRPVGELEGTQAPQEHNSIYKAMKDVYNGKAMKDAAVAEETRKWSTPRETDIDLVTKPMRFDDAELQEQPTPLSPGIEVNDVSKE